MASLSGLDREDERVQMALAEAIELEWRLVLISTVVGFHILQLFIRRYRCNISTFFDFAEIFKFFLQHEGKEKQTAHYHVTTIQQLQNTLSTVRIRFNFFESNKKNICILRVFIFCLFLHKKNSRKWIFINLYNEMVM